ncbi:MULTISPECIES: RND family transporter [unclassified Colwellia]|uniref:efflux RND transporter permease subunit n=1 Tax=unclassified Colwellia TaxID=196834 RepID=UPI0015F60D30|nr:MULTISPECIES: MMPL family transporter [unclassified Colwellia]MBA6350829.1 RND family transporter [Colwellia sp. BRX9-1]MBA6354444.1 RND family transporter [Colwellia sp. BRX8-3]MBA6358289.1 RND family transporter [Colwellia sp. BRX8-6]MBA6365958.1 RND family transporter [Colwellia sp. BRX8-5]MBA6374079.1 RND family transporter [Colwellia sp. BRX8-2]
MSTDKSTHTPSKLAQKIEQFIFSHRALLMTIIVICITLLTLQATKVKPEASFTKMIPGSHTYVNNFLTYKKELADLGNVIRIVVENKKGDIFNADFQETLKQVTDEVFYIPGISRDGLKSLWTPNVRWQEVTEEGFVGGAVIPDGYNGTTKMIERVKANVFKSGQIGVLVANDFQSAIILAPLQDINPETGLPLDYRELSSVLEEKIRDKYSSDDVTIRIVGFAKVVGDLIDGALQVVAFFVLAVVITFVLLWLYSRCLRSTISVLVFSIFAVFCQLGILNLLGFGINPYSMLVPFLVFAIGVSHGVQIINSIIHHSVTGADKIDAAKLAFRSLYIAGITALVSDAIGFTTLMVIDIEVIRELAIAASIGVAIIIVTNLIALPILMSYIGVSPAGLKYAQKSAHNTGIVESLFKNFAKPPLAKVALAVGLGCLILGLYFSQSMKIGDLDAGAPELRPDSRYNLDNAYIVDNYSTSTDLFVIMVKTEVEQCAQYQTLVWVDQFQWQLRNVAGVQAVKSVADVSKFGLFGMNEGSLKWYGLNRNQLMTNASLSKTPQGLMNKDCSMVPVLVFLKDHKAQTLDNVVKAVEKFNQENQIDGIEFLMAAGNAGIESATNMVIEEAQTEMLVWVYAIVIIICLITFRSGRIVICIITPLILTSIMSQGLMGVLGIGVKVATLPVIALGVGIGVDYGIYIFSKVKEALGQGKSLYMTYRYALNQTGKAVAFTGITLAIGVATWVFSPIKFQADMGILLTFMFIFNMLGALTLIPAIAWLLNIGSHRSKK